ncbi:MAG TPA: thioredoxin domain-containing protein [Pyrinomonadaceae bacterium]|nr:thioredoxin domain-containing protein [Pyrinomonadaceae bacterium]
MEKKKDKQSGIPLVVIGLVLVGAVILFAWCSNSSKNTPKNTNATANAKITPMPEVSQAGAQPPNFLGSPNATVTVEEFADFQCPSCGQAYPILHEVQSLYGPRIKFIFRNFPLPMHDKAYDAAVAAEAAGIQGQDKFWAMHAQLYQNQKTWSADPNYKQTFKSYAEKIGLNIDQWETDMAGLQVRNRVQADIERGKALNINSTPTVFVNRKEVPFQQVLKVSEMQKILDDELKAAQPAQQPAQSAPATNVSNSGTK